ncbi:MAG TPA: DinB family protein, partial [Gemmatimonadaceae bacterium]
MNTRDVAPSLETLFAELINGAPGANGYSYMLNSGDRGLLRSLDLLSASDVSARPTGGASIAAHVDHLRYGLSLMNRWAGGENPFNDADWSKSWEITTVSDAEWSELRGALKDECRRWIDVVRQPREMSTPELHGVIGSIAHLAYHLGLRPRREFRLIAKLAPGILPCEAPVNLHAGPMGARCPCADLGAEQR